MAEELSKIEEGIERLKRAGERMKKHSDETNQNVTAKPDDSQAGGGTFASVLVFPPAKGRVRKE